MLQTKKLNASMIATVVLSVLLAVVITFAGTNAWFASADQATGNLGLTGDVTISISEGASAGVLELNDVTLVPSHPVPINLVTTIADTNTPFLVRARFDFVLTNTNDPLVNYDWSDYEAHLAVDEDDKPAAEQDVLFRAYSKMVEFLAFRQGDANGSEAQTWSALQADGWYYLGYDDQITTPDTDQFHLEIAIPTGTDEASPMMGEDLDIDIISEDGAQVVYQVPSDWEDDFAYLNFEIALVVQAMQAEFYATITDDLAPVPSRTVLTLANVQTQFTTVHGAYVSPIA